MDSNICAKLRDGISTTSAEETEALAASFAPTLPPDTTLALHGNLGAGKTTFVRGLAKGLGIIDPITSPTFSLYNLHRGPRNLLHLDAYRIEHPREVDALLLEDFLISPWCLVVEWPEKIAPWLPEDALHIEFGIAPDERHTIRLLN